MNRDLIVFGEDWGGLPSSTQHLIHYLAQDRKVVWINSIGLRRPTLTRHDLKRIWRKLTAPVVARHHAGVSERPAALLASERFTIVNPTTLPAPRSRLARRLAAYLLKCQLQPVIEQAALHDPIVWTSLPTAIDVRPYLNIPIWVYYCGDDFSSLAGVDHDTVSARERELVSQADLILTVSEALRTRFPPARTHMLPHGVDYPLFATPAPRAEDLPNDGKPIAGFYGSLSAWLDYELLHQVIAGLPHWHFVFIGQASEQARTLLRHPNVIFLGSKAHHALPRYSQHWSVSLLPFQDNGQIQACNPLKLREYLASGRPIVSTDFPALEAYRTHVTVVEDADTMITALIHCATQACNPQQQAAVQSQTWAARAETLTQWLDAL